ncbi:GNAT family N-acetyltransferase [Nocardioides sp. Soil805]|uniref:GNAT family N-acetyltransferase n=1 Tax=Nocardioides sp. Soil805 TaxID=1736416 RepID=UPI000703C1BE|nr:GNAT family N-acetyltransferase [Nocardioides sp. Soil805]KRF32368.1 hypothetical protein ASG94_18055 [Nocardioides sp. Soil805]
MSRTDLPDIATLDLGGSRGPQGWIEWNLDNYAERGFGLWVVETHAGQFVGDCGLTMQEVEGEWLVEAGWHVSPSLRRQGYAAEAAGAVRAAAAGSGLEHLIAIIRPANVASRGVAEKIGLALEREVHKNGSPALVYGADLQSDAAGASAQGVLRQAPGSAIRGERRGGHDGSGASSAGASRYRGRLEHHHDHRDHLHPDRRES